MEIVLDTMIIFICSYLAIFSVKMTGNADYHTYTLHIQSDILLTQGKGGQHKDYECDKDNLVKVHLQHLISKLIMIIQHHLGLKTYTSDH